MHRYFIILSWQMHLVPGLSACNTVQRIGQDIQIAGGAIEGAAKK